MLAVITNMKRSVQFRAIVIDNLAIYLLIYLPNTQVDILIHTKDFDAVDLSIFRYYIRKCQLNCPKRFLAPNRADSIVINSENCLE